MTIPVILLNYNSTNDCRKCISHLQKQTGVDLEIIVVDNCSREENRVAIEKLCQEVKCTFIANSRNAGYNAGNNVGLKYAAEKGYEYALIANPDMEFPQTDTIIKMISIIENAEDIVALGTDIITKEGIHQNPRLYKQQKWYKSFNWIFDFIKISENKVPSWIEKPNISHYCNGLNGCCLLLRLSFIKHIGYFDERIFLYGEEAIFARQVESSSRKMYYASNIQVVHNHQKSKEGNSLVLLKHWKHSRLHAIKYYSNYPLFGKMFANTSIRTYFFLLELKAIITKK